MDDRPEQEEQRPAGPPAALEGVGAAPPGEAPLDEAGAASIEAGRIDPLEDVGVAPGEIPAESPPLDRALPDHPVLKELLTRFEDSRWELIRSEHVAHLPREHLREFAEAAREAGFEMCVDVTAVDYFRRRPVRFEVVVGLLSLEHRLRLRLLVPVPGHDPTVPSLVPVYPGANFFEREAYDMYGIAFEGHPDPTRILMPDDWEGYPLRKDYGVGSVPVQFKDSST
ncbi:MAG: NADH-quinone oxidoreductase subunit C [Acidimicrobiia bacterium]